MSFPRGTTNILSADIGVSLNDHRIFVSGQKLASGTSTSGALQTNIITEKQVNTLFGRKSHIAKKIRTYFKSHAISRRKPQIDAIALDDNGTTKATGTFTFGGTATENEVVDFYIDSTYNGKYSVSIVSGDTADVVGGKLETLVNANLNANYTASNTNGVVTITAENAGTNGNTIRLGFDGEVAGVTIAKSGESLVGGATDPILTSLFDPIDSIQYKTIDYPSTWDLDVLKTFTESRFNVVNDILYGQGFSFRVDTYANLDTLLDGLNAKTLSIGCGKINGGIFESPDVINSAFCAYRGLLFTEGSNVSAINSGNGQSVGGIRWASIPYFNMLFDILPVIKEGGDFSTEEKQELEKSGGWTFQNNKANTNILSRELRTTYKTNDLGDPDPTFTYLNRVDSLTIASEYIFNGIKQTFPRHTWTSATQEPSGGKAYVTQGLFIATLGEFYDFLVSVGIFEGGHKAEYLEYAQDNISFDKINGKVTDDVIAPITSQLREFYINILPVIN